MPFRDLVPGDRVSHREDLAGAFDGIVESVSGGLYAVRWGGADGAGEYRRGDLIAPDDHDAGAR